MVSWHVPRRPKLILFASGCLAAALIVETSSQLFVRVLATPDQREDYLLYTSLRMLRYAPHHYLNYYPTPYYQRGLTSHNSLGYRGREIETPKPAGVFRIVALGGSSTYDTGVPDDTKTFTSQLERVLIDAYLYEHVELVNAGVSGYTSWELLINLEVRVLDLEPDMVIVYEGMNDVLARLVLTDAYRGDNSGMRRQWEAPPVSILERSAFARILSRRLGLATQVGVNSFVDSPAYLGPRVLNSRDPSEPTALLERNPPAYLRRNLMNMVAVARTHDVQIVFATWAYSPQFGDYAATPAMKLGVNQGNHVVEDVAKGMQVSLFDFAAVMPEAKEFWADGGHLNANGSRVKAELFARYLDESKLIPRW